MGLDCYLLLQQEQYHLPEELDTSRQVGPNWYQLLQQEQQHLPEELDRWNLTAT